MYTCTTYTCTIQYIQYTLYVNNNCYGLYVDVHVYVSFISDSETHCAIAFHQQKRAIATEIGSAFHDILELFKTTKSNEEKKKVASDMTNETLGMLICVFCT